LGLSTSTISRRISRLEDDLGLALFERGRSGIRLTAGGKTVMRHVCRALAELDAVERAGRQISSGETGEIRLGVRMPPIGKPLSDLLGGWRERNPNVAMRLSEMNERDLALALDERRLDAALIISHAVWPGAATTQLYSERLVVAVPSDHPLANSTRIDWDALRGETILVQGWDESQAARELYASLLGSGTDFRSHAASKLSLFALVSAGCGITLTTSSQSEIKFPGVVFRPIDEPNASVQIALAWPPALEDPVVGRFIAFMRDEARLRGLL
jgi:DNA-binding transcriptional LysR family regulator